MKYIDLERDEYDQNLPKRSNSYPLRLKCQLQEDDDVQEEEVSEKGGKKKVKKKLKPIIKGDYKGNPYKVNKNSKFIASCEVINHTLHKSAMN